MCVDTRVDTISLEEIISILFTDSIFLNSFFYIR
jgi:hypothetical protein